MRILRRVAGAALAGSLALGGAVQAAPADARERDPHQPPAHREGASTLVRRTGGVQVAAVADLTPAQAIASLNAHRARYGVPPVVLDSAVGPALDNHARYVELNAETDDDLSSEEAGRPGYTTSGAEIAPYAEPVWTGSLRGLVGGLVGDPYLRTAMALEETATSIGFGSSGTVRVAVAQYTGEPPTGYPRTYPRGTNVTDLRHQAPWLSGYGCSGAGFPVTVSHDYATRGEVTDSRAVLRADGVSVPVCTMPLEGLAAASAAMVPQQALQPGTHYTGEFTTTLQVPGGTPQVDVQPVEFTTAAAATAVAGDQTGDRAADLFAVDAAGALMLYKGRSNGSFGHGWKVGSGWGSMTWLAMAGDVNGDARSDLLARRNDGTLWLYHSTGAGGLRSGIKVGQGWNGLSLLTVVGDMDADGGRDLVGRNAAGELLRYSVGATSVRGMGRIGTGWGAMRYLVGLGSLDGDRREDILAVRSDGTLWSYHSGTAARPIASYRRIGHGWGGFTAVLTPGDLDGDGRRDLVGRNAAGELYSYSNRGTSLGTATRAGTGFGSFRLLA